jgi:hypothetical protein
MLVKSGVRANVRRILALLTVLPMAVTFLASPLASAQEVNNAANTLKVSPVRTDISIPAGETKSVEVIVTNLTSQPLTVRPIENDFVAGDERGTPSLILDENQYAPTHSLKRFMTPLTNVTIPANESKIVNVVISVPKDAQAGGYFGALRFAPVDPSGGGQVNLSASVASLILMTVPGPAVETLELTDFKILQDDKTGSFFLTPNDIIATVRFQNKGNIQLGPFGKVTVTQGSTVVYDVDFNDADPREVVLPDSARRWDIPLDKIGTFGYYTVTGVFTYGSTNQTFEVKQSFWVIPLWMIITAIVVVVLLIALAIFLFVFLRSNKRRRARRGLGNGRLRRR